MSTTFRNLVTKCCLLRRVDARRICAGSVGEDLAEVVVISPLELVLDDEDSIVCEVTSHEIEREPAPLATEPDGPTLRASHTSRLQAGSYETSRAPSLSNSKSPSSS